MGTLVKKNRMYKSLFLIVILLFVVSGAGVTVDAGENAVNEKNLILVKDESYHLNATLIEGLHYYWESRDPKIACVDSESGVVTAMSKGKVVIDLFLEGVKVGKCSVKVESPKLNVTEKTMSITDTVQLKVGSTKQELSFQSGNDKIARVSSEGLVTAVSPGSTKIVVTLTNPTTGKITKYKCKIKVNKTKLIALTFDDGPGEYTPMVLDALEKHNAKATFFVVGSRINKQTKKYLKRADKLGCEIGNHTYSHLNVSTSSLSKVKSDLEKTDKLVKSAIGEPTTLMRPPYGSLSENARKSIDKAQILWSVDTLDWKYRDTNYIVNYVLKHASDGDVVLMHDIHKTSARAVEAIVKGLTKKGYKLVTVSELAEAKGQKIVSGGRYGSFK